MSDDVFVDTNIFLRAFHSAFPEHGHVKMVVDRLLGEDCELWISRQVVREYLVQVTHPNTFTPPLTIEQVVWQFEQVVALFHVADDTREVTEHLLALLQTYPTRGKQIHDANIVATMRANNIRRLLTLNRDDFRRYEDHIVILTPDAVS